MRIHCENENPCDGEMRRDRDGLERSSKRRSGVEELRPTTGTSGELQNDGSIVDTVWAYVAVAGQER